MKNYKLTISLNEDSKPKGVVVELTVKAESWEHADNLANSLALLMTTNNNGSLGEKDSYFGRALEEKKMTPLMTGEKEVNILGVVLSIPRTVRAVFVEEDGSVWATTMPASCQKTNEHEFMKSLKFSGSIPTSVAKVINDYLLIEV